MTHEELTKIAHNFKTIAIVGGLGVGKTCLSFSFLEQIKKKKTVFIFKHPNHKLIETRGYKMLYEFGQIEHLQDCAIYIDEPQLIIKRYEKKSNIALEALMTLARQRNITLMLSTADTRFITRGIEYFVDLWCVLDINADLVKRGSTISHIIKKNALITTAEWRLPIGKYYSDSRKNFKLNDLNEFKQPKWFDDAWSKPFRTGFVPTKILRMHKLPEKLKGG